MHPHLEAAGGEGIRDGPALLTAAVVGCEPRSLCWASSLALSSTWEFVQSHLWGLSVPQWLQTLGTRLFDKEGVSQATSFLERSCQKP